MAQYLYWSESRSYTVDFSKAKVRCTTKYSDGTSDWTQVMDKYSVTSMLQNAAGAVHMLFLYDCSTYGEIKDRLLAELEEKQFANVTIIK